MDAANSLGESQTREPSLKGMPRLSLTSKTAHLLTAKRLGSKEHVSAM